MLSSAEKLARAGADFLIAPSIPCIRPSIWWSIVLRGPGCTSRAKSRRKPSATVTSGWQSSARAPDGGPGLPRSAEERRHRAAPSGPGAARAHHRIIFDELVHGTFLPRTQAYFTEVIRGLKDEGCDAVVLACTEIPLLMTPESSPLPMLDSTRILARAALRKAVEG